MVVNFEPVKKQKKQQQTCIRLGSADIWVKKTMVKSVSFQGSPAVSRDLRLGSAGGCSLAEQAV